MTIRVLGLSASPRNSRRELPLDRLAACTDEQQVADLLAQPADDLLAAVAEGGAQEFATQYRRYRTTRATGWSNTEVALASALWGAARAGAQIEVASLNQYYSVSPGDSKSGPLLDRIRAADAVVVATPVYFGDRSSLVESLLIDVQGDRSLRESLSQKVFGGVSVGAKRNGGQETALLFQLYDAIRLGFAGVGNGDESTAQYGGTCVAGDIGAVARDTTGLRTAVSTGSRVSAIARLIQDGEPAPGEATGLRVVVVVLQDDRGRARALATELLAAAEPGIALTVVDVNEQSVHRCIACNVCPTHAGPRDEYRCVISTDRDALGSLHTDLSRADAVIPVLLSRPDAPASVSSYQTFVERSRYLRRDDYAWGDAVVVPLLFQDLGSDPALPLRVVTSMVRHSTVLQAPVILAPEPGEPARRGAVDQLAAALRLARRLAAGRVRQGARRTHYQPDGYVIGPLAAAAERGRR